jgi:mono/diheme cytochrome c family protein
MRFIQGFVVALIVVAIAVVAVAYSGVYNVAADAPGLQPLEWLLATTSDKSVTAHAKGVQTPSELTEQQARAGLSIYRETCVYCHGAPGQDPGDIGKGLNPEAPYLPDAVGDLSSAELFWIIKHGIRMTGMASYGKVHNDEEIWSLVAFVQRLQKMTPEQYKQMEESVASKGPGH